MVIENSIFGEEAEPPTAEVLKYTQSESLGTGYKGHSWGLDELQGKNWDMSR